MSDYSVKAVFSAEDRGFTKAFQNAGLAAEKLSMTTGKRLGEIGKSFANVGKMATVGLSLPIALGFRKAVKSSSDFETAMTGVRKTTEFTDSEFAKITKSIRGMSKVLPAGTTEIAKVAEAAGQLGIKKEKLLDFTKVMLDLGYSTNLSAETGAVALSRFANITQMSQDDFSRLGSTIVDLGNNFATSEAEIVNMGLRLAGTGAQVGLSEAQILGLATAMSSVGIKAEAGGMAFSRVMQRMHSAVVSGSEKLQGFASISGMTAEQFSAQWKADPQVAIAEFIKGLGKAQEQGLDTVTMLKDLGIASIRESDSLTRLAKAGGLLDNAFEKANTSWDENIALAREADLFYATFESRMEVVKNRLKDVGIEIGDRLKPMVAEAAEKIADLAEKFLDLSPGMQDFILKVGLIVATLGPLLVMFGLIAGAISKAITGFASFSSALTIAANGIKATSIVSSGFSGALGTVIGKVVSLATKFAPVIAAIGLFVGAIKLAWENSEIFRDKVSSTFDTVKERFGGLVSALEEAGSKIGESMQALFEAFGRLGSVIGELIGPILGVLVEFLGGILVEVIISATNFIQAFGERFEDMANKVTMVIEVLAEFGEWLISEVEKSVQFVESVKEAFMNLPEFFSNLWENIKAGVSEAWTGIKEALIERWEAIKTSAIESWNGIKEGIISAVTPTVEKVKSIWENAKTFLSSIWENIKSIAKSVWELIKIVIITPVLVLLQLLTGRWSDAANSLKQIWEKTKQHASNIWNNLKQLVSKIVVGLVSSVVNSFNNLKSKLSNLTNNIKTAISNAWQSLKSTVTNLANNIKTGVVNAFNNLKTSATNSTNNLKNTIKSAFTNMLSNIKSTVTQIPGAVSSAFSNAISAARGFVGQAVSAGANLIGGFVNGVRSAAGRLISAVTGAVSGAINRAKSLLGIRSPSRVFMKIGQYTGEGMAVGIDKSKRDVLKATKSMAKETVKSFKDVPKSLKSSLSDIGSITGGLSAESLNLSTNINAVQDNKKMDKPLTAENKPTSLNLNLRLGNRDYKVFVDDISREQGRETDLVEAYGY